MKITYDKKLEQEIYRQIRQRVDTEREGWHASDFLYCNYKTYFRKRGESPKPTDEQCCLYWSGFAFQYFLMAQEEDEVYEIDGIYLTPDIDNKYIGMTRVNLGELKTTRSSIAYFKPEENEQYIRQMQCYCKAKGVTEAYLIVFFLMGEYGNFTTKDGRKCYTYKNGNKPFPTPKVWHYEFTDEEIEENWQEILRRRDILDRALRDGEYPEELIMAFKNECRYCENHLTCPASSTRVDRTGDGL